MNKSLLTTEEMRKLRRQGYSYNAIAKHAGVCQQNVAARLKGEPNPKPQPKAGDRFGRLVVVSDHHRSPTNNTRYWLCRCDCGNLKVINGSHMRKGRIRSCGCLREEWRKTCPEIVKHRLSHTRTHRVWTGMIQRCTNPNGRHYARYGGRGIKVCERWNEFLSFLEDMGQCPPGMTLDRINNDGNYEPGNCRWTDHRTQMNNTSRNLLCTFNGVTKTLAQWIPATGTTEYKRVQERMTRGWSFERAFTTPPIRR